MKKMMDLYTHFSQNEKGNDNFLVKTILRKNIATFAMKAARKSGLPKKLWLIFLSPPSRDDTSIPEILLKKISNSES